MHLNQLKTQRNRKKEKKKPDILPLHEKQKPGKRTKNDLRIENKPTLKEKGRGRRGKEDSRYRLLKQNQGNRRQFITTPPH